MVRLGIDAARVSIVDAIYPDVTIVANTPDSILMRALLHKAATALSEYSAL